MRVEELIIEGFKSFVNRTVISGWDTSFNAITGLNGSGKSNILDAICFVLGLTNLQAVRANNLQDLIYKRGQAGITKASVTIVFDNSDKTKSPVGYEAASSISVTRQIAMGGISKYLINGHKSHLNSVHSLFQSVQLNINNPNFVIMQGKITKVLNMKPEEILSMVEEAAGTRMYEDRKEKAYKTMEKKQRKVAEIESQLKEEIIPRLDKLRSEKSAYLSYQKASAELERLDRLVVAHDWCYHTKSVAYADSEVTRIKESNEQLKRDISQWKDDKVGYEEKIKDIKEAQQKELAKDGKLAELDKLVKQLSTELVKSRAQADIKRENIIEEKKNMESIEKSVESSEKAYKDKEKSTKSITDKFNVVDESYQNSVDALAKAEELLQTLQTGLASSSKDDTGAGGFLGQMQEAKARATQGATEYQQSQVKKDHLNKEIKDKERRVKDTTSDSQDLTKQINKVKTALEKIVKELESLNWDDEKMESLQNQEREQTKKVSTLSEQCERLKASMSALDFSYTNPYPNFDRSKVHGLVANLIDLHADNEQFATALEVCAGGRLYNVVVEDEKVSTALLEKGQLRKRVTIIPLNKIKPTTMSVEKLSTAEKLAPGKVRSAISLVGSEDEVATAMSYVFGEALVCDDAETAQKVTFHPNVKSRSVTLKGDVYDPSGVLSGGSAPSGSGILVRAQTLRDANIKLKDAQNVLKGIREEISALADQQSRYSKLKREHDLKQHELELLEEQLNGSSSTRLQNDLEELKKTLIEVDATAKKAKEKESQARKDCDRLEREMEEFKNDRGGKLEELKADVAKRRKSVQKQSTSIKAQQKEVQTAQLELEQLEDDMNGCLEEHKEAVEGLRAAEAELEEFHADISKKQKHLDQTEAKLDKERNQLDTYKDELNALEISLSTVKSNIQSGTHSLKSVDKEVSNAKETAKKHAVSLKTLEKTYDWISDEQDDFGREGSVYDFNKINIQQASKQRNDLSETQKSQKNKINGKVMTMIDTVEKREQALKTMMDTILGDKEKIEDTIHELDHYKKEALQSTWKIVNKDFGEIFGELLPGNFAKLQPPEGKELTQGLEVKVRLGQIWKQSLTELSGGQRSLIALSLIMSLLQFRPAPMYILDEIDAALDLSHTQHIGHLFRNRFRGSQFIVVSLKEGLFSNANVIFRARFRDGTSLIERTETRMTGNGPRKSLAVSANATTGKRTRAARA
ncbi:putative nuclear condensin complex protein [Wallemia mellicola]|uniref:Structural maintenance of chromosomes protein n=1 Tax=Wallemia mellicola TaxID=1708541 RepID=A0A4V4N1S4_9BASI|nr:putative nuclear condensin complex protein [Wallemia mellicola]TIC40300.1 putative nuclear condensin complex protein [Wallemia mellicola]TIC58263.1 putative nuclear condensin complex protein [Wallemia mellicola]TIC68658.1 putative nuclear condensin complex protein [Wallemia mellicola]